MAITPLLIAVVGACAVVLAYQLDETLKTVREYRYASVAMSLASTLEAGLDLGVPIEAQRQVLDAMRFEIERDPSLLSIDVFDPTGRLLFTTDAGGVGDRIPAVWQARLTEGRRNWTVTEGSERVTGTAITNNFNKVAGGVALRHAPDLTALLPTSLMPAATAAVLTTLVVGWLLLRRAFAPVDRRLHAVAAALTGDGPSNIDPEVVGGLASAVEAFRGRAVLLDKAVEEAAAKLRRIDDGD